jgi:uncharacterized protein YcnI
MSRTRRAAALALLAVAAAALPASAHVTVNPSTATKGGFAKLSFRVPTEKDNAGTTRLEVTFPAEHPLAFVSVRPHPGWTFRVTKAKLAKPITSDDGAVTEAVSTITWTGGNIGPGQFDEFDVSVGPLPKDADELVFKAVQGYSDGSVVRWIDLSTPGGAEPAHPAPVLHLVDAESATPSASATPAASASPAAPAPAVVVRASDVRSAKRTATAGLGIGAAALALAVVALARRRRA